jgi:hypothetical protein
MGPGDGPLMLFLDLSLLCVTDAADFLVRGLLAVIQQVMLVASRSLDGLS